MKNLDILIFTRVVILCFITFFISTFRAFESVNRKEGSKNRRGIISRLLAYFQSLVSE
jgi:hypothetical protein